MIYQNIEEGYYWLTINADNNDVKYVVKVYTNSSGVKGIGLGAWDGGGFVALKHVMADELNTLIPILGTNALDDILSVQGDSGNWNWNPYMHGLYNGIEVAASILGSRRPELRMAPTKWLENKNNEIDKPKLGFKKPGFKKLKSVFRTC